MNRYGTPITFGHQKLFGMLHLPSGRARDVGVLMIDSVGYESICAHRCYRRFAEELALGGHPTLRYDHPGTGNSAGEGSESLASGIAQAIQALLERGGVRRVVLFGVRAGALLALARAGHPSVAGVFAWATPRNGRSWLRELAMLAGNGVPTEAGLESAGFWLTRKRLAELRDLEPQLPRTAPVVCVPRDDLPDRVLAGARALRVPGYAAMMRDPHLSEVPSRVLTGLLDFLLEISHPRDAPTVAPRAAELLLAHGRERPLRFGEDHAFGVCSAPHHPQAGAPVVLMLNPGAVHHIGMNRMYVRWARELAARGVPSLRFDISGIGESPAHADAPDNQLYSLHAVADVRAAIDFAERAFPDRSPCLVGLCAGAYAAYHSALADSRVRQIVLINPQTFSFNEGDSLEVDRRQSYKAARYYRRRFGKGDAWRRLARGDVNLVRAGRLLARRARDVALLSARGFATRLGMVPPSGVARELASLADAGVKVSFVYSGDDPGLGVLADELGAYRSRCFARDELSLDVISGDDGPDHTFTQLWSQDELTRVVTARLLEASPPDRRSVAPAPWDEYRGAARATG